MDILNILSELEENQVSISLDGKDLEVNFMQDEVPDEIITMLKANKPELVSYLEKLQDAENYQAIPNITAQESYPLSSSQMRLWVLSQFDEASLAYNLPFSLDLEGDYNVSFLNQAIHAVIERHEILRTVFKPDSKGEIRQWIIPAAQFNFECQFHNLSDTPNARAQAEQLIKEDNHKYFDLEKGPLLRVAFYQLNEKECIFYYNMHHIISDGWSMKVLAQDVIKYYNAYQENATIDVAPLRIQYKDFAAWQQEQLYSDGVSGAKEYWTKMLQAPLPVLNLPSFKRRPAIKTFSGNRFKTHLPEDLLKKLKIFSKEQEGSLFSSLITIWKVLFYHYTNEEDFVIATPSAGRFHSDLEDQIGFYVNTLVLRNQIDPEENLIANYQKIKENTLKAISHQDYPFDALVEDSTVKRDASRSAIFDVMIALQNAGESNDTELDVIENDAIIDLGACYAKFDLEINLFEEHRQLALTIEYNKDVYEEAMIKRMFGHFKTLAYTLLENANEPIKNSLILTASERELVINTFNDTKEVYEKEKTVIDLFTAQAKRDPKQLAVKFEDVQYTFEDLDQLSNQLAKYLQDKYKVGSNDLVGIQLDRSERMPLSIIAILKSGAAYVPLGMDYPEERVAYIVKDAEMKVVINEAELTDFFAVQNEYSTESLVSKPAPTDLAYCIYTSGSTGKPKGVLNQHDGLFNRIIWMRDYLNVTEQDIFLQKTPYTFDVSVWEFVLPIIAGSTLVVAKPEGHKDPDYLKGIINETGVSIIHFVPSMLGLFLQFLTPNEVAGLKHIICSGEELPAQMVNESRRLFAGTCIHNLYGPTEAAIDVTAIDLTDIDTEQLGVTIGKPIANTRIYIVDERLNPLPVGIPGELLIAGIQVAKGYLNLDQLSQERFIDDPFVPGDRVYKTGDIGFWEKDGTVRYLGRRDNQVKIRGNRIELGEIDNSLSQLSQLKQAVVIDKVIDGEKVLVAYLSPKAGEEVDKTEIKAYLQKHLPEYMVPAFYVILAELPLTSSGKINRKLLPEISTGDIIQGHYIAPEKELEKEIASLWQNVLGVDRVGTTDNFFDLGGHSLKVGQLINLYGQKFSVRLKFKDVFHARTIQDHARMIEETDSINFNTINKAPELKNYPASEVQKMIWLNSLTKEGIISYNVSHIHNFTTQYIDFDLDIFNEAFKFLLTRHEILRTVLKLDENDEVRQWILPVEDVFSITEADDITGSENQKETIMNFIYTEKTGDLFKAFDFEKGPLFRFKLFKVTTGHVLYSVFHHIITDGVSSEIIIRDFLSIYNSLKNNTAITLEPLKIQYKDYAYWQYNLLQSDSINKDRDYWLNRFDGKVGSMDLPSKLVRPKVRTSNGRYLGTYLTKDLTSLCYNFGSDNNGSLFMTVLAIWNIIFYKYTSKEEIVLGASIAGRNDPQLEDQLGCYINVLALLNKMEGELSFHEFYEKIKETTFEAFEHQMYPLNALIRDLKIKKDVSRSNPLYDVILYLQNFENLQKHDINLTDSETEEIEDNGFRVTKLDVEVGFHEKGDHLKLMIKYSTDVYDFEEITKLMKRFKLVANALLTDPHRKINDISLLNVEEEQLVLNEFNDTREEYDINTTVIDLFNERAAATPTHVAVRFENIQYTYLELDQWSNQLAAYLQDVYKIGTNDLVGIQLERSERMPLSIISIMKAGAAYVPIGMDYPEERISYIIKDAEMKVVINDEELSRFYSVRDKYSQGSLSSKPAPRDLAYCIYTSGSTGKPKGVLNQHDGLFNRIVWMKDYLNVSHRDIFLQKTPYTFDVSVWEFVLPMITGSALVMARPEGHKDPKYLKEIINQEKVSIIHFVPSMLGVFLQFAETGATPGLQHIVCSGEALPAKMVSEAIKLFPETRIHNLYGPTEAAIDVTAIDLTNVDMEDHGVSIGKPVANTRIYIVDEGLNPQPVGIPGELLIAGVQVARGYLNLPKLTKERFIDDPFIPGDRVYKTGDLAKWLPNGEIAYIGRIDNQVKIRGNRIEIGEIEVAISKSKLTHNAVIMVKGNDTKYLVAYVIPKDGFEQNKLFDYLKNILPDYMIPARIVEMDEFPLTRSGKVDRKLLPDPSDLNYDNGLYQAPQDEIESMVAEIWQEVLELEQISTHEAFFQIGGDSLKIIKVHKRVKEKFDFTISIAELYNYKTIKDFAGFLKSNLDLDFTNKEPAKKILEF